MKKYFHFRIKRSNYLPLFALLLTISLVSLTLRFSFGGNSKDVQNQYINNIVGDSTSSTTATTGKYRYSHLLIPSSSDSTSECYHRRQNRFDLLIPYGLNPATHKPSDSYVLVLGSGGLVGSALEPILREHGYKTLHVLSRHHLDLRINNSLDIFDEINITFVFFLAYEVGGAKFLQRPELQDRILEYNIEISNNVFGWLKRRQIRYAFASSSLSADKSNYGYVKRLGENITLKMPHLGRVFRLWNAYGFEFPGPKSHAIPDFVFQCLAKKKVKMLTSGKEIRQFTHVNDISEALIAIMEYFDETPLEVDISDGNWLTLVDTAKEAQMAVEGCKLEIPEKPAKVQKRHEANLTSNWHQHRWSQKMKMKEGVQNIVNKMSDFIKKSEVGSAVTFIIDCRNEITQSSVDNLRKVVKRIDEMNEILSPMRIEILAAANYMNENIMNDLPCTILINSGSNYLRKAVKFAHSVPVVIMNQNILPTMEHLYFFQREIPRDLIFYFAEEQKVNSFDLAVGETVPSLASFQFVNDCFSSKILLPDSPSFVVATKDTWLSVKVPPNDVPYHDWLMRLRCGYISIKFESPVWSWGNIDKRITSNSYKDLCCHGVFHLNKDKSGDTFVHYGKRKLIN